MSSAAWLRRARDRSVRRPSAAQIATEANPADPRVVDDFRFFAIIKSWNEEDVIRATVLNAFTQGVEAVFLVDNASTDRTVEEATAAGAVVAESYRTDLWEGRIAQVLMNATIIRESLASEAEHVWWLVLDCDEFPEGPGGRRIADYLRSLDSRFRVVGSRFFNHLPTGKPEYLPGFHPIDFQPCGAWFTPFKGRHCRQPHWKHPLQRFDRKSHFLESGPGAHTANLRSGVLVEPAGGIVTHHFQFREESFTRSRLDARAGEQSNRQNLHFELGYRGPRERLDTLDVVYGQRWDEYIPWPPSERDPAGLRTWPDLAQVRRWYAPSEVDEARNRWVAAQQPARESTQPSGQ